MIFSPAPSKPPSGLSATILSSSSLSISWMSVSDADGYIVYYNGGEAVLIEGQDSTNRILNGLNKGTTYTISVYSYSGLVSETASVLIIDYNGMYVVMEATVTFIVFLFTVPIISSFLVHPLTSTSVMLSWSVPVTSVIDSYTVVVTRICDNTDITTVALSDAVTSYSIEDLSSGFQYNVSIKPDNIFGEGMKQTESVTLPGNGKQ